MFIISPSEADAVVHEGVLKLNEDQPGWLDKVDLDKLNLQDCRDCTLGQVFGSFELGHQHFGWSPVISHARHYGFDFHSTQFNWGSGTPEGVDERRNAYRVLTEAWKRAILRERAKTSA